MPRAKLIVLITAAAIAIAGCGQTAQEKAKGQVCSAGTNVAQQVTQLDALPASQLDPRQALQKLMVIGVRLKQIRDALGNLDATKAQELRTAEEAFRQQFGQVVYGLVGGMTFGTEKLQADLEPGLARLAASWRQTVAPALAGWCPPVRQP